MKLKRGMIIDVNLGQKIRSQASPFKGMKKNQLQYFKPLTLGRGTDN